jgi:hypothetical protein
VITKFNVGVIKKVDEGVGRGEKSRSPKGSEEVESRLMGREVSGVGWRDPRRSRSLEVRKELGDGRAMSPPESGQSEVEEVLDQECLARSEGWKTKPGMRPAAGWTFFGSHRFLRGLGFGGFFSAKVSR